MALPPWKVMALAAFLSVVYQVSGVGDPKAIIKSQFQLVVLDGTSSKYTVTLDGSPSTEADRYRWSVVDKRERFARLSSRDSAITNVTVKNITDTYLFKLDASNKLPKSSRKFSHAYSELYVEKPSSVGMYLFSSSVIEQLIKMQYQYIALSQYHQRATHYHPKVVAYFKKFAADRAKMLDDVTEHVLAKQATEDLINSCPTDYVNVMMTLGFIPQVNFDSNVTEYMTSGFEIALQSEAELARRLSHVAHHADRNRDYELSEFVAADLLPRVTKVMNTHKNHLETTLRPANALPTRPLVEFLFDKHLKI